VTIKDAIENTIGSGIKNTNPNPAKCHGAQSPKILNSNVRIPNNHKMHENIKCIIVILLFLIISNL
jgi:hypothetical protein